MVVFLYLVVSLRQNGDPDECNRCLRRPGASERPSSMAEAGSGAGGGGGEKRTPGEFVRSSLVGRPVTVKLSDNTEYRGVLVCLDGFMNVALEQADEFAASGSLKSKLGDCFIRGNNGAW